MSPNRLRLSTFANESSHAVAARLARQEPAALKLQFLASLNHEIRTPLSGILGMSDLLMETALDEDQRDYVMAARQCAEGLFELLNDTLEYTSLSSGCVKLDESEFHLADTLKTAVNEHLPRAEAKGVALEYAAAEDLPSTVFGDAFRVRQVLSLLLQHAIKTTEHGTVQVTVGSEGLAGRELELHLRLSIPCGDDSPATVRRILETFDEIETGATRRFDGIGLGLALTRRVLQLLRGDLVVEERESGGSIFTAEIPLKLPLPALVTATGKAGAPRAGNPRILVVEDNRISQQVLCAILAKGNYEFDCVSDGYAAIDAANHHQYSLILMDLQMPGIDGLEATDRILANPANAAVPIVALTAEASDHVRTTCRQRGMAGFLSKPIQASELLEFVHQVIA